MVNEHAMPLPELAALGPAYGAWLRKMKHGRLPACR